MIGLILGLILQGYQCLPSEGYISPSDEYNYIISNSSYEFVNIVTDDRGSQLWAQFQDSEFTKDDFVGIWIRMKVKADKAERYFCQKGQRKW